MEKVTVKLGVEVPEEIKGYFCTGCSTVAYWTHILCPLSGEVEGELKQWKTKTITGQGIDWIAEGSSFLWKGAFMCTFVVSVCRWSAILVPVGKWHFGLLFSNPFPTNTRLGPVQPGGDVGLSAAAMGIMNHLPGGHERYTKWINFK